MALYFVDLKPRQTTLSALVTPPPLPFTTPPAHLAGGTGSIPIENQPRTNATRPLSPTLKTEETPPTNLLPVQHSDSDPLLVAHFYDPLPKTQTQVAAADAVVS